MGRFRKPAHGLPVLWADRKWLQSVLYSARNGVVGDMRELVHVDLAEVEALVRSVLPAFPEIAGAYLFGSCLGGCRPDSDIDVGLVLVAPNDPLYVEAQVEGQLGTLAGHPFHVTALTAGELAFEVVRDGRLVFEQDRDAVTEFIEQLAIDHHVSGRYLETFNAERRERLRKWL